MSQREVAIMGRNNTQAAVTGQEELLVKINSIEASDSSISAILSYLSLLQTQNKTHNVKRDTLSGTIPKPYSFSVANVGTANGTVEGVSLKPGEVINFDAGVLNNRFDTVTYDATGTEFLITWVI